MEKRINIAEILKDCPKGMELNCTMFDNVTLEGVVSDENYPIQIRVGKDQIKNLSAYGEWYKFIDNSKCVIFPKEKTSWIGFVSPCKFKEGDIVFTSINSIVIIKDKSDEYNDPYYTTYCGMDDSGFFLCATVRAVRFATEEEKDKLFKAIKDNGYKWNAEKKCLEKLEKPQYPKTYKECCDILGIDTMDNDVLGYKEDLIIIFQKLIICRDAYWKNFNGGHWCPDYEIDDDGAGTVKFCIKNMGGKIEMAETVAANTILAFPTIKMRDTFYENFKKSIEMCKELL